MNIDTILCEQSTLQSKIALLSDGKLKSIDITDYNVATEGNIYLGTVTKKIELVNGQCGYMINIGQNQDAFLNGSDKFANFSALSEGDKVVVQVSQEARAEKGAKVIRSLQIVGQYLVYCPYRMDIEVSSKITDKNKAQEYRDLICAHTDGQEGWILRTSCVEATAEDIISQMKELKSVFEDIVSKSKSAQSPSLLKSRNHIIFDYIKAHQQDLNCIITNSQNLADVLPNKYDIRVQRDVFKCFDIEEQIFQALEPKVMLPGGGRLFIEETKACVSIDVDSGADGGHGQINRLNMEASSVIAEQIVLRNLSGKIVVDFAGSSEYKYMKPVIEFLIQELKKNSADSYVCGLSRAGLVEIVRPRRKPTLKEVMHGRC